MTQHQDNLIWIDLEMTGLDPEKDRIIEIATIATDAQLNILAEGPAYAIKQPQALLDQMDEWNTKQHNHSGLVARIQASEISERQAEAETLAFIERYVPIQQSPMCGNSVYQDRRFLIRYMPTLLNHFHYRNLDVSTLKELAKRWAPTIYEGFKKESQHLALADIKDSIAELRYYREHLMKI